MPYAHSMIDLADERAQGRLAETRRHRHTPREGPSRTSRLRLTVGRGLVRIGNHVMPTDPKPPSAPPQAGMT